MQSLRAKNVCDAVLELWQFTGCCSYISSDVGTLVMWCLREVPNETTGVAARTLVMEHPKGQLV